MFVRRSDLGRDNPAEAERGRLHVVGGSFAQVATFSGSVFGVWGTAANNVYVAKNGKHFPWNAVRKNRKTGIFEGVEGSPDGF